MTAEKRTINIADFGAKPDGSDSTSALRSALAECKKVGADKLVFPKGRYLFKDQQAVEKHYYVSNNDGGMKRIAFLLEEFDGLEIDGQGSDFVFDGVVSPFILDGSKNVTLKNFSIDFIRTFHNEGKIIADVDEGLDVEFSEEFPYEIMNGVLVFTDGREHPRKQTTATTHKQYYTYGSLLEFDPVKRETAFMAKDFYGVKEGVVAKQLEGRKVRLMMKKLTGKVGNIMVFGPRWRNTGGIVINRSSDTCVENVTIYHCGGMGVIGQLSHNISLKKVEVKPSEGRIISATADATHYVNCTGRIEMSHCFFELQKDDSSNIHGVYAKIVEISSKTEILVQMNHPQQYGIDFIDAGDELEFVERDSLIARGAVKVKSVERMNAEFTRVKLEESLPDGTVLGDAVAEIRDYPKVHIHHCRMRGNRARGFLLNSRGKTLIEDNYFHIGGASLLFEGDARFWFEQAGVSDCVIRNNVFDNCNYGVWGNATIEVGAGIEPEHRARSRYNSNIVIEGNTFKAFDKYSQVKMFSVDGVTIKNNTIEYTDAYPKRGLDAEPFDITDSDDVVIKGNKFVGEL